MKIINDKLKPIEDKQTKFMEIINKLLIHNEKDKDVSNKKVLKKQNVWKNIIKGNDNLFKGIDFIVFSRYNWYLREIVCEQEV